MIYLQSIIIFIFINYITTSSETGFLNDESIQLMLKDYESVEKVYFPHLKQDIDDLSLLIKDEKLPKKCKKSLIELINGIMRKEHWALSFYDSSSQGGKSGKFSGLRADFGHFDECIRSKSSNENQFNSDDLTNFNGQFCMLSIKTNEHDVLVKQNQYLYNRTMSDLTMKNRQWYEFNLGNIAAICIPSTCRIDNLLSIINQKLVQWNISIASQKQCTNLNDLNNREFSLMELISILILSCCLISVLIGTYYPISWWRHFDLVENNRKLFKKVSDPERLRYKSIHGFKFLYLLLSIMAHIWFIFMPLIPLLFGGNRNYDIGNILFREISAGSLYLVDAMFLIGGLLTCIMWYPLFEKKKGKISFFTYALLRWLRTTPVIVSVLLIGFIYPRFGSGPFFNDLANHMQTNCQNNFWKNLLYIANFDRGLNMCFPNTWYISCDYQLYLLHYFTIYYLYERPKTGLWIAAIQILISCVYIFYSTLFKKLPSYLRINEINLLNIIDTESLYFDTLVHSNVYTIGIIMGWLMVTKRNIIKVKSSTDNFISLASFLISLSIFFIPSYWINTWINVDSISKSILLAAWASIVRIIFVFYFVYAFYSYSLGRATYLRFLMGFDFQVPFSRICLSIVVAQFIYILYYFGSKRDMISFNTFDQTKEGIAAFFICSVCGYLLYLLVEAPFANLLTDFATRRKEVSNVNKELIKSNDQEMIETCEKTRNFKDDFIKDDNFNLIRIITKENVDDKKIN